MALRDHLPVKEKGGLVFLGGTVNGSKWRDEFIPMLERSYFNPVVEEWTPECKIKEDQVKACATVLLYVITPKQKGFYSIAELVADAISDKRDVVVVFLESDGDDRFDEDQIKSNVAIGKMLTGYCASVFYNLEDAAAYINLDEDAGIVKYVQ